MIRIHFLDGMSCPFFVCDVCKEMILDGLLAMAVWGDGLDDNPRTDGGSITPAHAHKGACLDAFEARLPAGHHLMTDELTDHVEFMLDNSRLRARRRAA